MSYLNTGLEYCARDAKLVVLDWDELSGDVRCSSLHSWEGNSSALKAGQHSYARPPKVYADPQVLSLVTRVASQIQ